ncbi:hypothetical protein EV360DRAFT_51725 [Lentinula raphanica]|nr:hypothetical protein EV360DRAFT_51725 [Lentinula raphanica]
MNPKALAPTNPTNPPPSTTIKPSSSFAFIEPKDLSPLINNSSALIIDIRPHAAYSSARIPTALSLSVPSTLLKRPLFSLDRLGAMLPSSSSRSRFSEWPKFSTILVYDVDSTGSPFLPEGSNILGLLRKFSNDAAYSGSTLLWLKGGFQRVWRECRDLVDFRPPDPEAEEDSNESGSLKTAHLSSKAFGSGTTTRNSLDMFSPQKRPPSTLSLRSNAPQMSDKINVTSSIPFNPFFDTIRQNIELTQGITERIPLRLPKRVRKRINDLPFEWLREISRRADVKPEDSFSSDGDNSTPSISDTEYHYDSHPKMLPPGIPERYSARHRSTDPAPKHLDPPPPDQTLLEQGMEALAQQFYHIELAEQKRLMGVMKHHSAESDVISRAHPDRKDTVDPAVAPEHRPGNLSIFPYSITAGVEKGAKNRYRHIWPFEHARVRLHLRRHSPPRKSFQPADPDSSISLPTNLHSTVSFPSLPPSKQEDHDDYVNASYVQPLCTTRRYIATQGPLEATFVDFWTLVYQQNVHVIVMLTREIEGSMVKCGPYWKDEVFGPLRLKLISVEGNDSEGKDDDVRRKIGGGNPEASGFFFNAPTSMPDTKTKKVSKNPADAIIKRTFLLSHTGYPDIPPRKVVQFQYLEWPDMNVPDDPRGVLGLIREVDQAGIPNNVNAGVPAIIRPSLSGTRRESEESLNRFTGIANNAVGRKHSPVLLHCSAGVGRTGGFIAVDAVLDGLRRELRKKKKLGLYHGQGTSKLADTMHIDEASRNRAVQDGQGNWNWIGNTDVDMKDSRSDLHTIAIPANHRGNILHVPVHHPSTVRYSYLLLAIANRQESNDGLSTPTAPFPVLHASQDSTSAAVSAEASINPSPPSRDPQLKTPMQVDQDFTSTKSIPPYPRQSSTTRMWAEDVSDQTGSHGTAYRVDDAMRRIALTSSTGTSFSSLQSLSGSAVPQSTISQVKDGDQLPARNVRGEEARVRTWSAPSARFSQSETDQLHGLRHSASPFTSSPLVMGDRSRAVEKSPSPVPHFSSMMDHDDSASLPPLSRSLSPSIRPNSSLTVDNQLSSSTMDSSREGMAEPSSMLPDEPQAFPVSAKNLTLPTSHPNLAANSTPSRTHNQGTRMQDVDQQILASRNGDPHSSPDLSYPRPLHNDQSPQALSSLDEPLMEVLQDMREQRMSLCQSLRQYVFVHAAVIEGALMIVDEEREREKKEMGMDIDDSPFINQSAGTQSVPEASSLSSPKRPRLRSKDAESSASAPSTGKRLASPTELPKEDRKGDQMLFKRPSIKKKAIDLPIKNPQEMT